MSQSLKAAEKAEAKKNLLGLCGLKPGDAVYTILRSVSRSGMSRHIDAFVIRDWI